MVKDKERKSAVEMAEDMAKVAKKTGVSMEEFAEALIPDMTDSDAVKAAEAGRRLRKYLQEGMTIEEVKALYEKKEELKR
jgi:molybdenum cofactor biosynthesis enzyme